MDFGKVFNSLWHNLYTIWHIFSVENGQILKTQFVHLVTLDDNNKEDDKEEVFDAVFIRF